MRKFPIAPAALALLCVCCLAGPAQAAITYFGDGSAGGLVPDFPQIWSDTQKVKAICDAAAYADAFWYFDQHGYSGLVSHTNAQTPNTPWRSDAQALVFDLGARFYGRDPMTGALSPKGSVTTWAGAQKYLVDHKMLFSQQNPNGLTLTRYALTRATDASWYSALGDGTKTSLNIAAVSWRTAGGANYQDPKAGSVLHAMTSAGLDSDHKQLVVVHGWDDHPGDQPPYKKPPYAAGEKPYINQYNYDVTNDGKMSIPNQMGVDLFGYNADHVLLDNFNNLAPGARAQVKLKPNPQKGPLPGGGGLSAAAAAPGLENYDYQVENDSFAPIYQFTLQVNVPFSMADVNAPAGWQAVPWDANFTPDMSPPALHAAPPGVDPGDVSNAGPDYTGILFFTTTHPVLDQEIVDGFSYNAASFPIEPFSSFTFLSDGLSSYVDPSSTGLITQYGMIDGPAAVPLPPAAWSAAAMMGLILLASRCRRYLAR